MIAESLFDVDEDQHVELRQSLQEVLAEVDSDASLRNVRLNQDPQGSVLVRLQVASDPESQGDLVKLIPALEASAATVLQSTARVSIHWSDVLSTNHVAHFGGTLFSRHLIAVQVVAILLLAALVGAIAIASRDHDTAQEAPR